ncbi:hypothetical protein GCM10010319_67750 [Streptomyces blastmyceticus]|uniref:Proteinase inhibitor I78 n=2 Tax=Streptomyces TaxID=1883 RepID=A0ABN0Y1X7_9ACTN
MADPERTSPCPGAALPRPGPGAYGGVMAPLPNVPADPHDDLDAYVGLEVARASERARTRGWATVRTLPPGSIITMEYQVGRLNFEVVDGAVRRCWKG